MNFKLKVKQVESNCNFELSWGQSHSIDIDLNYPSTLNRSYEQWRRAYLNYYQRLRGKALNSGIVDVNIDYHKQLVDTEKQLLNDFQRWLLSPELVSIRSTITAAANECKANKFVEVFLTCTPLDLARLPWEVWDIASGLDLSHKIRIARAPANIIHQPVSPLERKAKILVILGDDSGLDLSKDEQAVKSWGARVDITFVGWKNTITEANFDENALKNQIVQAISHRNGWDMLFFIGHSNETALTGGELGIAPKLALSIDEIEDALRVAIKRGLQFAIFNSCSGINIAESLIKLGLSQVAVMREPIHNKVAPEFLKEFLRSLAEYNDVHTALLDACQLLNKQENRLSYPSSYLVPSLFRHPEAQLFRIKPYDILSHIKRWLPTKQEAVWLFSLLLISSIPVVQDFLLEPRILLQAVYRKVTFREPTQVEAPTLLIKIDNKSFQADKIEQRYPLDYNYLAKIIQQLSQSNAQLIGIDYILSEVENQPKATSQLQQTIQRATNQGTSFVFGFTRSEDDLKKAQVSDKITDLNKSLQGDIDFTNWYMELPANKDCFSSNICPFSYQLAVSHSLKTQPKPANLKLFHPIIDFSIPPKAAYTSISACELLGSCPKTQQLPKNLRNMLVIIAPGGYDKAGVEGKGEDNATIPLSIAFWRGWGDGKFPKGEAHAYMVHHFLQQHFVIVVPDIFILLITSVLAKYIVILLNKNPENHKKIIKVVSISAIIYFIISLEVYISASILLPCFLSSILLWKYISLTVRRISNELV